jgi:GNAT superfamily N-acetyltransferase
MTEAKHGGSVVIEEARGVQKFVQNAQEAADASRAELGFFPARVYQEFATRGQLYVATDEARAEYRGHLLFDCRYPRAHVLQMYVHPPFRQLGIATILLRQLKRSLTESGFIAIYARVAEDLQVANAFWAKQDFYVQRVAQGGATRHRTILVRAHELASPQLFEASGLTQFNPLGLPGARSTEPPVFLLDLNVLFDVGPRRPRHEEFARLCQAERMNFCRLAISSEAREELKRTASSARTDPMQEFVSLFPTFPLSKSATFTDVFDKLRKLIFPQVTDRQLTANEKSDVAHVATVIQHNLAGLVTNDGAILNAAAALQARFALRAVSSAAFSAAEGDVAESAAVRTFSEATLECRPIDERDAQAVHALLGLLGLHGSSIAAGWIPSNGVSRVAHRMGAWRGNTLLGYLTWPAWSESSITARLAVDERDEDARDAARVLLMQLLEKIGSVGPQNVSLAFPANQSVAREIAFGLGFSGAQNSTALVKVIGGQVWTSRNWEERQSALAEAVGLKLPLSPPSYRNADQQVEVLTPDGNRAHISLSMLESLLSPAIFCLDNRPAVITPIQRIYSEPLLGHSQQDSLLPGQSSSLFAQKHFVSSSRSLKHFRRGTIILFYESGKHRGRAALVAIARVQTAFLREAHMLSASDFERSVLTADNVGAVGTDKLKTVTIFESVFPLLNVVPMETLVRLGCGRPNDLITTHPITNQQFQEILRMAFQ